VLANLDALLTALYVRVDDLLPKRRGPGHPPRISDAELIALAVAQMFLGIPNDRKFLALAGWRLGHLFPYLPQQPGYNKRLRRLAPTIARVITHLAVCSPSFGDNLRLLDSTPVPCGQSRETARRSELAGCASYGWCKSHSRYFRGFRLYLGYSQDTAERCNSRAPSHRSPRWRGIVPQWLRAAVEDRATALSASSKLSRALMATAAVAPLPAAAGTSARGSEQLPAA
jgi:hypothetical protein